MEWFRKSPILILVIVLSGVGVTSVYGIVTITLAGNVIIEGDTQLDGNFNLDGAHSGLIWNNRNPSQNIITTVDSDPFVGGYNSITIGPDGLPIVSYQDNTNDDLKVLRCSNPRCDSTSENSKIAVDTTGIIGEYTSVAIGSDGLPVISYLDPFNFDLKVAHCGTLDCSSGNTITIVDSTGNVGAYSSITIGPNGFPLISYYAPSGQELKYIKCLNLTCSSKNSPLVLDSSGDVGWYTSMAVDVDRAPIISYFDFTNKNLKFIKCISDSCIPELSNFVTTIDSVGDVGWFTSLTVGVDNLPVISYFDNSNKKLKVVHCGNKYCSSGNAFSDIDVGNTGHDSSITIGVDGFPVISYYDFGETALYVAKCGSLDCSGTTSLQRVDNSGSVGEDTSIAIGTDGLPIISYYDSTNDVLKIAKCGNPNCQDNWIRR